MLNQLTKVIVNFITIVKRGVKIFRSRDMATLSSREISTPSNPKPNQTKPITDSFACPYCQSHHFVKRGLRKKKFEYVQLYLCKNCHKTFTPHITKGKHYPLTIIFDAISYYNLGYSLEKACQLANQNLNQRQVKSRSGQQSSNRRYQQSSPISPATLSSWLSEFKDKCRFLRMRQFAMKKYAPADMVIHATLAHRQLYRFHFHQAKCELMIQEDFKHRRFGPLQEFLEMVPAECPHQYFTTGLRASETPLAFSKKQMIVRSKQNYATRMAKFVLQSVNDRRRRHEALQKFMLYNDSVTVATEVPVYLTRDDLEHMQTQLGFEMYLRAKNRISEGQEIPTKDGLPKLITGHIDFIQIRNGQIHILDYKPQAKKQQPVEQLTLYAMALSRLTGLRLFEFKCAWFDDNDYFEFYPLHVLYKPAKRRRRKRITTNEGVYIINQNDRKIENLRPRSWQ